MTKVKDLTGQRFGRLLVLSCSDSRTKHRTTLWICQCDCGATKTVGRSDLTKGTNQSCGCARREMLLRRNDGLATHRMHGSPTYNSWQSMKARCLRKTDPTYHRYGARGITVCERWLKFENFLADMGKKPEGTSLDRIDNYKGYGPDNCRWATFRVQGRNKRTNRILTCDGESAPVTEWAERTGINTNTLYARISHGWSHEHAIKTPVGASRG